MDNNKLSLKWPDHNSNFLANFDSFLDSQDYTDCTLRAEGQSIRAHKLILATSSSFFYEIFRSSEKDEHCVLVFDDIKFHDLKTVVQFMYRGQALLTNEEFIEFLKATDALKIKGVWKDDGIISTGVKVEREIIQVEDENGGLEVVDYSSLK